MCFLFDPRVAELDWSCVIFRRNEARGGAVWAAERLFWWVMIHLSRRALWERTADDNTLLCQSDFIFCPPQLKPQPITSPDKKPRPPRARSQMDSVTEFWSTCVIKSSKRHLLLFNCSSALWALTASWTLTWGFCNNHMIKYTLTDLCKPEEGFGGNF